MTYRTSHLPINPRGVFAMEVTIFFSAPRGTDLWTWMDLDDLNESLRQLFNIRTSKNTNVWGITGLDFQREKCLEICL